MLNELQWESLESRREQFRLVMLYKILKQNVHFPSEHIPDFCRDIVSTNYKLDIVICLDYLSQIAILMFTSIRLCHVHRDYGTPYVIKLLRLYFKSLLRDHYIRLNS